MLYPDRIFDESDVGSFDQYEKLCIAADKYDMPSAIQTLLLFVRIHVESYPPIQLYALLCRLGDQFRKEAVMVSTRTLSFDLDQRDHRDQLMRAPIEDAFRLQALHRARRDDMVGALSSKRDLLRDSSHWSTLQNDTNWLLFQHFVLKAMEDKPDGSSLKEEKFYDNWALNGLWELTCDRWCPRRKSIASHTMTNMNCGMKIVDKLDLRTSIIAYLDQLPKLVHFFQCR